jgi:hypothetical protein
MRYSLTISGLENRSKAPQPGGTASGDRIVRCRLSHWENTVNARRFRITESCGENPKQGQATSQFIEEFLACFSEETRKQIEDTVEALYSLKDFARFRKKLMAMFAAVYANGVHDGRQKMDFDYEKLGEAAGRKIHEEHKEVLKPIP